MFDTLHHPPTDLAGYDPVSTAADGDWYDGEAAQKVIDFFTKGIKFTRGFRAGESFILEPWQSDFVRTLFGWRRADGTRRYRMALLEIPRKNGKSALAAGLAAYMLVCEAEAEAQLYCAASNRDQASLVFNQMASFIRKTPWLDEAVKIRDSQRRAIYEPTGSFVRALPANEGGAHGFDSHCIIGDELHAWPGREFYDVLHTSTGARLQPLEIYITTAGFDRESVCYNVYREACDVRDGRLKDRAMLPLIYEPSADDDWNSPKTWAKCNPNLGVSVTHEYIEREYAKAVRDPSYQNTFRRLHLNEWTEQESRWLDMNYWRDCYSGAPLERLTEPKYEIFAGLDVAAVCDFTAWVVLQRHPDLDDGLKCVGHYWLPEEKAREYEREHLINIQSWVNDGWLTLIPEARIDQRYIEQRIMADRDRYGVNCIGFDMWNAEQMRVNLESKGFKIVAVTQGFGSLSAPSKELQRHVLGKSIDYQKDPIMTWMASNAVAKEDINCNVRPIRDSGRAKIDGIVALIMALHTMQTEQPIRPSIYSEPGNLAL